MAMPRITSTSCIIGTGIHEMKADEMFRAVGGGGKAGDGDGGGVGGEQRVGSMRGTEVLENLALDGFVFGRRFDDEIAVLHVVEICAVRMRVSAASIASSRDECRARPADACCVSMVSVARSSASVLMSSSMTSKPASAKHMCDARCPSGPRR